MSQAVFLLLAHAQKGFCGLWFQVETVLSY